MHNQSERNIRGVRSTILGQIEKKVLMILVDRQGEDFPFTMEKLSFLTRHEEKIPATMKKLGKEKLALLKEIGVVVRRITREQEKLAKEESISTEKYLSYFLPFDKIDFRKKGVESSWSTDSVEIIALIMTMKNKPQAVMMSFQKEYAEPYEWLVEVFRDWAFTFFSSFLYYLDYDRLDENERNLYRQGMAAFGSVAPTYRIELRERPTIVWDFNSLLLCIQMMFSFMLTVENSSMKVCKTAARLLLPLDSIWNSVHRNVKTSTMCIRAERRRTIHQHRRTAYMNPSSIIMYTTEDGLTKIETTFEDDTVWISIDQMAELFQRDRSVIGKHVRNIPCRYSNEDILFYFYRLDI